MRASDRTLLASMAFADRDRQPDRAPIHDLAVRYVMQPDVALAIWGRFAGRDDIQATEVRSEPEALVKTHTGFVVGFADAMLIPTMGWHEPHMSEERWRAMKARESSGLTFAGPTQWVLSRRFDAPKVVVEVKVVVDDPGAAVRQLKLYADLTGGRPVLVAVEPVSGDASAVIKSAGIGLAHLGPKFHQFAETRREPEPDVTL